VHDLLGRDEDSANMTVGEVRAYAEEARKPLEAALKKSLDALIDIAVILDITVARAKARRVYDEIRSALE